jgi:hypothetical protein
MMIFERSEISKNRRLWIFWSFDKNRMSPFKRGRISVSDIRLELAMMRHILDIGLVNSNVKLEKRSPRRSPTQRSRNHKFRVMSI